MVSMKNSKRTFAMTRTNREEYTTFAKVALNIIKNFDEKLVKLGDWSGAKEPLVHLEKC